MVQQFQGAGLDLASAHQTLSAVMNGEPERVAGPMMHILRGQFANMALTGISADDPLAIALRDALGSAATPALRAGEVSTLLDRLTRSEIDMNRLTVALDNLMVRGVSLPDDLTQALQTAGVDTDFEPGISLVDHPLIRSRAAIRMAASTRSRAAVQPRAASGTQPSVAMPHQTAQAALAQEVNNIIQQLRNAEVDLVRVHRAVSSFADGNPAPMTRRIVSILQPHFPNLMRVGLHQNAPLALALREALAQHAPAAVSSAGIQPQAAAVTQQDVASSFSNAQAALAQEVRDIIQQLQNAGIDLTQVHRAVSRLADGNPAPMTRRIVSILQPHFPNLMQVGLHQNAPLALALEQALGHHVTAASQRTAQSIPPRPVGSAASAQATANRVLAMPEGRDLEDNQQYAWRLYLRNRWAPVERIAFATVASAPPDRRFNGDEEETLRALRSCIADYERIEAKFNQLRTISKANAERLGFRDAALYNQDGDGEFNKEFATSCLFGEDLSLSNPNQLVIGLAQVASDSQQSYNEAVNKEVVFMDMKKLAEFLAATPKHPMNNVPLSAANIEKFAFRIS
ncbi:hypothetical protein [Ralstonia sp. A12]|uniref:hypothetical protein n=1 Tax=Ralstonia sp. A12 TaxID=1217052 RepID=UPI0006932F30|nr:hypothetical protein [Ralstonia sp. A12]